MTRPIARYEGPVALSVPAGATATIEYQERRAEVFSLFRYDCARDPRIRTLERRKAVTKLERRFGPCKRHLDMRTALWCNQFRRKKPWDYDRRKG